MTCLTWIKKNPDVNDKRIGRTNLHFHLETTAEHNLPNHQIKLPYPFSLCLLDSL